MRASSPMGRKFVIADPATCIGCKTCMAACFHRHDVPNDVAVPRLTLVTTRTISAPVGCHHCAEAPCVDACPTGCLFTDDEHVGVHPDKCIGCRNCVLACPYGAVEIVTEKLPPEPEAASGTEAAAASAQDDDLRPLRRATGRSGSKRGALAVFQGLVDIERTTRFRPSGVSRAAGRPCDGFRS